MAASAVCSKQVGTPHSLQNTANVPANMPGEQEITYTKTQQADQMQGKEFRSVSLENRQHGAQRIKVQWSACCINACNITGWWLEVCKRSELPGTRGRAKNAWTATLLPLGVACSSYTTCSVAVFTHNHESCAKAGQVHH